MVSMISGLENHGRVTKTPLAQQLIKNGKIRKDERCTKDTVSKDKTTHTKNHELSEAVLASGEVLCPKSGDEVAEDVGEVHLS